MKILVTAFDPFGGEKINPASELVKRLPSVIAGAEIVKLEVPTAFHHSAEIMAGKARELKPDVILNIGQAGGRTGITPERVAINQDDARIKDNEGNQLIDEIIQADGPAAYFSTLPIKAMVQAIKAVGLPAYVSNSAGTFVCNHLMYQTLYFIEKEMPQAIGGFIHIPYMMEQVASKPHEPAMSLDDMVRGLVAAIQAIVEHGEKDLKIVGGETH